MKPRREPPAATPTSRSRIRRALCLQKCASICDRWRRKEQTGESPRALVTPFLTLPLKRGGDPPARMVRS